MGEPPVLNREEVIERLATMMRDEAYPEFGLAPAPEWARRAAAKIIDYHQPMLRDYLVAEAVVAALSGDSRANGEPGPESLDAAWAEAEAALPRDRNGTAFDTSGGRGLGLRRISSRAYQAEWGETYATGETPAAALRSLASRLRALREADPS